MKIDDAIATLDKRTSWGVARFLRQQGIKGTAGLPGSCPVARYLYRVTAIPTTIGPETAAFRFHAGPTQLRDLPSAAADFVRRFDGGKYRYLQA